MKIPPKGYLDTHFEIVEHSHGFDLIGSLRSLTWSEDKYDAWKTHDGNLKWMALIFLFQDLVIGYGGDKDAMLRYLDEFDETPYLHPPGQCECDECQRRRQKEDDDE